MPPRRRDDQAGPAATRAWGISARLAPLLALALLALAIAPGVGQAAQLHAFAAAFGGPGAGAGQLSLAYPEFSEGGEKPTSAGSGIAVNDETHDLYVADTANHRVSEFSAAGVFIRAFGWGVADGSPELQSCTSTCEAGLAGGQPGQLETPTFIAVDNDLASPSHGDVYVADTGALTITKFTAAGALVSSWGNEGQLTEPPAAAGTGNLTAGSTEVGGLVELSGKFQAGDEISGEGVPPGTYIGERDSSASLKLSAPATLTKAGVALSASYPFDRGIDGIGADPAGNLWLQVGARLFEFNPAGTFLQNWTSPLGDQPTGIALDGSAHLYSFGGFPWGAIHRFTTAGTDLGQVFGSEHEFFTGIASSQSDNTLYLDREGSSVVVVSPQCTPSPSSFSICPASALFGAGNLDHAAGLAVDSASGAVYAASTGDQKIDAFPLTLEATIQAATAATATTATLHGTVDPKGTPVTHCAFQYGATTTYESEAPCLNEAGEEVGTTGHPIAAPTALHAAASGLAGGSKSHFRLQVANSAGSVLASEDESLETLALATIDEVEVSELTAASATLKAKINPHGVAATAYRFEWGPCTSAGQCATSPYPESVPVPNEAIGAGSADVAVSKPIAGLNANTTYHYRVVVADANGTLTGAGHTFVYLTAAEPERPCANEALREANSSNLLSDCRGYELVTPLHKNGSLIGALLFNNIPPQIAAGGSRVIAPAIQCFADAQSCVATRLSEGEPFQFTRTGAGWEVNALTIPASQFETSSAWRFNPETGASLFSAPTSPAGADNFYLRAADGALSEVGPLWEEGPEFHNLRALEPATIQGTADFSHVLYVSQEPLWSFDHDESHGGILYEYDGTDNASPMLVGVTGGPGSDQLISVCGARNPALGTAFNSLSADGRAVFFEVPPCAKGWGPTNEHLKVPVEELYTRIDGEGPQARTVAISEPGALQAPQSNPACTSTSCIANTSQESSFRSAKFEGASADGTMAFFTSPQQLTDEASQDPNPADSASNCPSASGHGGCNLYLYQDPQQQPISGTHLFDASAGDSSGLGPAVQGTMAISADGSHIYFVAKGVLSEEANAQGKKAFEGQDNLYLYEHDAQHPGGKTTFLTTLSAVDAQEWVQGAQANVSPDGRYLVFTSHRGLSADAAPGEGPAQVYRYDAQAGQLLRVSIGQRGFDDNGNSGSPEANAAIATAVRTLLGRSGPARPDPTMSDDGAFVFFQSPLALTPGALDQVAVDAGGGLAQNVYEWEADGTRSCSEPAGCVSLISNATDTNERSTLIGSSTELLGADASGENVFFATSSQLNWADSDSQRDYYDARIGGGFAEPPAPTPCQGDACKGPGSQAGAQSSPASAAFSGPEEGPKHPVKPKQAHKPKKSKNKKKHKAKHHRSSRRRAAANQGGQK